MCCPLTAIVATPVLAINQGCKAQFAILVISICESFFDEIPIFNTRQVAANEEMITDVLAIAGNFPLTFLILSGTGCLAGISSVPA